MQIMAEEISDEVVVIIEEMITKEVVHGEIIGQVIK